MRHANGTSPLFFLTAGELLVTTTKFQDKQEKMKIKLNLKVKLLLATLAVTAASQAQNVTVSPSKVLVDTTHEAAFFPTLSPDGTKLLYSTTDATVLRMMDLNTRQVYRVSSEWGSGFDAKFGPDGKIYYVTMQRRGNNLIYRTGKSFEIGVGRTCTVVKPQHGAVRVLTATDGIAVVGEKRSYKSKRNVGTYVWTEGDKLMLSENGKIRTMQPVAESSGYLWASLSPDGTKIVFNAARRGTFVVDLTGRVIAHLDYYLMPCWFNNDYIVAQNSGHGSYHKAGSQIFLVKADGTFSQGITDPAEGAIQPMVVGDKVVYTNIEGVVREIKVEVK